MPLWRPQMNFHNVNAALNSLFQKKWLKKVGRNAIKNRRALRLLVEELEPRITPDAVFGAEGVEARDLSLGRGLAVLTGSQIPIGEVDAGRPGRPGQGNDPSYWHAHVTPTAVYARAGNPTADSAQEILAQGGSWYVGRR